MGKYRGSFTSGSPICVCHVLMIYGIRDIGPSVCGVKTSSQETADGNGRSKWVKRLCCIGASWEESRSWFLPLMKGFRRRTRNRSSVILREYSLEIFRWQFLESGKLRFQCQMDDTQSSYSIRSPKNSGTNKRNQYIRASSINNIVGSREDQM